jgi:hypothetical protein
MSMRFVTSHTNWFRVIEFHIGTMEVYLTILHIYITIVNRFDVIVSFVTYSLYRKGGYL